jgi:hypothetical protein
MEAAELVHDVCVDHEVALVVCGEGARVEDLCVEDLPDERNGREGDTDDWYMSAIMRKEMREDA